MARRVVLADEPPALVVGEEGLVPGAVDLAHALAERIHGVVRGDGAAHHLLVAAIAAEGPRLRAIARHVTGGIEGETSALRPGHLLKPMRGRRVGVRRAGAVD